MNKNSLIHAFSRRELIAFLEWVDKRNEGLIEKETKNWEMKNLKEAIHKG